MPLHLKVTPHFPIPPVNGGGGGVSLLDQSFRSGPSRGQRVSFLTNPSVSKEGGGASTFCDKQLTHERLCGHEIYHTDTLQEHQKILTKMTT